VISLVVSDKWSWRELSIGVALFLQWRSDRKDWKAIDPMTFEVINCDCKGLRC
jgi:hypothetical protein